MADSLILGPPRCVAPTADFCGEGSVWHPGEQAVYWVDINRFLIHRWQYATEVETRKEVQTWKFDEPPTALTLTTQSDTLLVVLASRVIFWQPATDRRTPQGFVLPEWPEARMNDARVDARGVLWNATMQNNVAADGSVLPVNKAVGRFFSLDSAGQTRTWKTRLRIGNTVAWSPDGKYLYTADTEKNEIYRFDVRPDGTLDHEKVWFSGHPRGVPDGSCVDTKGFLWNCRHDGSCLLRIAPDGTLDRVIEMPVKNPTTCIFGGPEGTTLYVASAAAGQAGPPENGGLFALETNVRGADQNYFNLAGLP